MKLKNIVIGTLLVATCAAHAATYSLVSIQGTAINVGNNPVITDGSSSIHVTANRNYMGAGTHGDTFLWDQRWVCTVKFTPSYPGELPPLAGIGAQWKKSWSASARCNPVGAGLDEDEGDWQSTGSAEVDGFGGGVATGLTATSYVYSSNPNAQIISNQVTNFVHQGNGIYYGTSIFTESPGRITFTATIPVGNPDGFNSIRCAGANTETLSLYAFNP